MENSKQSFDSEKQRESLLPRIHSPQDLRSLSIEELYQLAEEIRDEIVCTVSQTGGHLAPNLGLGLRLYALKPSPFAVAP